MNLDKFEVWVHDHILKNPAIRHMVYGCYQRTLYMISPKIKSEGKIRKLTPDDGYEYLFGYYDKCPWDETERYILALRVRSATAAADSMAPAQLVVVDTKNRNRIIKVAVTHSWNVQQGCMAQWLDKNHVLYNDFRNGKYCAVIVNIRDRSERLLDRPVYTISADKKTALTLDFSRLHRLRPGYGYANMEEKTAGEKCPDCTCIWKIDMETGKVTSVLKYTDLAAFEPGPDMAGSEHKVNHLMLSPNGKRFMVLHRWFYNGEKYTRLITADIDGNNMYNLSDDDFVSHCCWKNDEEILSYLNKRDGGKGYYLLKDRTGEYEKLWPELVMDGHPSYSYDGRYIVTDTYPNRKRIQSVYVMQGEKIYTAARVFSPFRFGGDVRCDLHPRWSRDGKQICFDGSFEGKRAIYAIDVQSLYQESTDSMINSEIVRSEKEAPKVSVVVPCYNCARFIDETLESLALQTYKDFEVICVNDGSSDETLDRLLFWQQNGRLNLHIVDQDNAGVSTARNAGIVNSHGAYILFLDSDDLYHEQFVELMVHGLEQENADTAYCRLSRKKNEVTHCLPVYDAVIKQQQADAMHNLLYRMGEFSFCNFIYKKSVLIEKNIFFDANTKFGEDREFNWKYLCHCRSAVYLDMPLYWYRVNTDSVTKSKASWRKTDLLTAIKRVEAYLEDEECIFSQEFNSYMYARAMWAVAKTFAVNRDKELYRRLCKEYPVRKCMVRTAQDTSRLVAFASYSFLLHPFLFYTLVRLKKQ